MDIAETAATISTLRWKPQPRQMFALERREDELLYGGAAGGGKTDFLLADFAAGVHYGQAWRGVLFRRTYPELEEVEKRSIEMYGGMGEYSAARHLWCFRGGAELRLRYLERDTDAHRYQGHQYTWIGWDELGLWPTDYAYRFLMSRARSALGVPVYVRSTANPGGPGHGWVKARFVDPKPAETAWVDPDTGMSRIFVPALLDDNRILLANDPGYERRLKELPEYLYRALRFGDWSVFVGQVFGELAEGKHVVKPFALEPHWFRFASMDWGYAKPFSIGWWGVTNDARLVRYREWYGCERSQPNVGIRMAAREVARKAWEISVVEGCQRMVADPACWNREGLEGASIAESFAAEGWLMDRANNNRVTGMAELHTRLKTLGADGRPMMLVFDSCRDWLRTMPLLVADPKRPEDIDTQGEDHIYDETRYAVLSPWAKLPSRVEPTDYRDMQAFDRNDLAGREDDYDPLGRR